MGKQTISFRSFEDLEAYLRTAYTVLGGDDYDFYGVVALTAACLDNLQANALEAQLEDIGESLSDSQKEFLRKIVGYL